MSAYAIRPEKLKDNIAAALGSRCREINVALDEVTVVVAVSDYLEAMQLLRDAEGCRFEQLVRRCAQ
jgi:NADH-quinone oxidoreductase subunit C